MIQHPVGAYDTGRLVIAKFLETCACELYEFRVGGVSAGCAFFPKDFGHAKGECPIRSRPVTVFVRELLFLTGLEDDGKVRPFVPERVAFTVVFCVRKASQGDSASEPVRRAPRAEIHLAVP